MDQDWGESVLSALSRKSFSEALAVTDDNLNRLESLPSSLIEGLFTIRNVDEATKDIVDTILQKLSVSSDVEDLIANVVDALAKCNSSVTFNTVLQLYLKLMSRKKLRSLFFDLMVESIRVHLTHLEESDDNINHCLAYVEFMETAMASFVQFGYKNHYIASLLNFMVLRHSVPFQEHCVRLILRTCDDPYYLALYYSFHKKSSKVDILRNVPDKAFGLFYHCIINESMFNVYATQYTYRVLLPLAILLITESSEELKFKGISLLERLTSCLEDSLIMCDINSSVLSLFEHLNSIMIYEDNQKLRMLSLKQYDRLLSCYNRKAKYHILIGLRSKIFHSGTLAFLISKIKAVKESCVSRNIDCDYFSGKRFVDLLKRFCMLYDCEKTHIVNNAEQILASLNFYYYLFSIKETSVSALIPELRLSYFEPLQKLISDTLSDIEKSMNEVNNGTPIEPNIAITNMSIPEPSAEDKTKSLHCSRNAVDLINMSLDRVLTITQ